MESSSKIKRQHVVAMPFPGRGHINPMMNFCKLLTTRFLDIDHLRITFVVTEEWLGFLESSSTDSILPVQIHLRSIPNVIPSELVRGSDHAGFLEAVYTKMEAPFEQFLDQLQQNDDPGVAAVTAIITDTLLRWAVFAGNRRNIPVASLWPMSASMFSIFYHIDLLAQNGHYPIDFSTGLMDEVIDYIPGVSPIRLADLPPPLDYSRQQTLRGLLAGVNAVRKAKCLLITSHHELEPQVTKSLMEVLPVPVYPVGPSIPFSVILEDGRDTTKIHKHVNMEEHKYLKWLDCQPDNSVLYMSFGSFLSTSSEQMEEIQAGLHESGVRYLLVSRGGQGHNNSAAGVDSDNEMGNAQSFVVPWCDQLRVLCHSSVGGFWTHCGWNSTLEGVYAGVPMLTFPVGLDQPTNSKLIVDDWKNGMKMMKEVGANRLVNRNEIAMTVQKFMNSNGDDEESRKMRRRSIELKESCRKALAKGGSSDININEFIRTILKVA